MLWLRNILYLVLAAVVGVFLLYPFTALSAVMGWRNCTDWALLHGHCNAAWPVLSLVSVLPISYLGNRLFPPDTT